MVYTLAEGFRKNFLGNSPDWYKTTIIGFLILNPILFIFNPFIAGWVLVIEFIFTLAMALKCYPLLPGGLLAVEAVILGMASPEMVYLEAEHNFPVIMLLMFMVAGIYFLREMLLFTFTKILLGVRSKILLSVMFSFVAAFLSAFLDALTVTAVQVALDWDRAVLYDRINRRVDQMVADGKREADQIRAQARTQAEEERSRLTREALADVDAGRVIDHQSVQAWADSLDTDNPLDVPR